MAWRPCRAGPLQVGGQVVLGDSHLLAHPAVAEAAALDLPIDGDPGDPQVGGRLGGGEEMGENHPSRMVAAGSRGELGRGDNSAAARRPPRDRRKIGADLVPDRGRP
jgi:hypothetical protein